MKTVISLAHEWRSYPGRSDIVKCMTCGAVNVVGEWGGPRCVPKLEDERSGFKDESDIAKAQLRRLQFYIAGSENRNVTR